MIAFGAGGSTPKQRMSQLSAGLGLLRGVVVDQHFEQRNRYRTTPLACRTIAIAAGRRPGRRHCCRHSRWNPARSHRPWVRSRWLMASTSSPNAFAAKRTTPLLMSGAVIHTARPEASSTLLSRSLVAHQKAVPDSEVLEARAAEADLRDVMREVVCRGCVARLPSSITPTTVVARRADHEPTILRGISICANSRQRMPASPAASSCCPESRPSRPERFPTSSDSDRGCHARASPA